MTFNRSLSMIVYGDSKCGKSTLGTTAPYPRLLIDSEMAFKHLPIVPKMWDPKVEAPPAADGTWDTCVVPVHTYEDMMAAYQYLKLGQHQFKSVVIDSISELQVKLIDSIVGSEQIKMQQWGQLLRSMTDMMRGLRDLTMHPTNPLDAVVITAMLKESQSGKARPYLQGQAATILPYLYDLVGYLKIEEFPHPDPTQPPYKVRRMYIEGSDKFEAGERVQGKLGTIIEQNDLNVETMINKVYGATPPAAETTATD